MLSFQLRYHFIYHGLAHFAVHLKNSHRKKEEIPRWTAKKKKKFLDGQCSEVSEPMAN